MKNDHAMTALAKAARFEAGKPADPTKHMSPEDAAKWKDMNEEHRDKFKTAGSQFYLVSVNHRGEPLVDGILDPILMGMILSKVEREEIKDANGIQAVVRGKMIPWATVLKQAVTGNPAFRPAGQDAYRIKIEVGSIYEKGASATDFDLEDLAVMANGPTPEVVGTMISRMAAGDIPADVERYVKETKESNPDYDDSQLWAVAWSRYCKYKNPGSEHCKMNTNEYFKSAMDNLTKMAATRSLSEIADEIRKDWRPVNYAAKPYLEAMEGMESISDNYYQDSGFSIVSYFLSNASGWKGDTAKRIKAELKSMLSSKRGSDMDSLVVACGGILAEGCPDNLDDAECKSWESNTEKYKNVVKDQHQATWDEGEIDKDNPRDRPGEGSMIPGLEERLAGLVNDAVMSEPDNSMRKNPLDPMATWEEGEIDLQDDPRKHPSEGSMIPGLEDRLASAAHEAMLKKTASDILQAIHRGDRVTIVNRFGQESTGTAVMKGPAGWVLNMGGAHGTPAIATDENIVKVKPAKRGTDEVDEKAGKFEEGKPADPTKDMSPEDAAEWKKQNEEHKDNFKSAGLNGYIAFFRGKKIEVEAKSTYEAQQIAAKKFGARRESDVTVMLAEKDGKPVKHDPMFASLETQWNSKSAASDPSGLYGYTRAIQSSCESSIRKMMATATKVAKEAYRKDENVAPFLAAHAKRGNSLSAKILVAAMKTIGPKVASEMRKAELKADALPAEKLTKAAAKKYGLYGYAAKTASLGLHACTTIRETAGSVTSDMHGRKADSHKLITGFLSAHAKEAKCMYSKMLCASYPDADRKTASVVAPVTVGDWLSWED